MATLEQVVATLLSRQQETAEQQKLLLERLIAVTANYTNGQNERGSPTNSTLGGSEALMETLAKSIREFAYDPEEGQTFAKWYVRYEDNFNVEAASLDDAAKVRLLLRKPRDIKFEDTIATLKKLFGKKESQFSIRVKCIQNVRMNDEEVITYAARVNRLCENFNLRDCTGNNFKCLMFVHGMQSASDEDLRARLLSMLDSETSERPLTIDNLVAEIQRIKNLKNDALVCANPTKVQAVSEHKQAKVDTKALPSRPCWQCGRMHFVRECSFTSHKCTQCGKVGHKEGYCSCFSERKPAMAKRNETKKKSRKRKFIRSVFTACENGSHNRRFVTIEINGVGLQLQHDTGSDVTIISTQNWKRIGSPSLRSCQKSFRDASANQISIAGEFEADIVMKGKKKQATITVSPNLNLLGTDIISLFELWDTRITEYTSCRNVQTSSKLTQPNLLAMFPSIFRDEIGHFTAQKVHLQLKPQAVPVFRPKRSIAYAARDQVERELKRLEDEGIISPINFSKWSAPIVVVKKASGDVRICGDYSTGLNDQLEPHTFPLPLPDEIFVNFNGCSYFSIVDAYMQIEVDEDTKKLLVINTHRGLYTFNRLAPGVKSAPGAFQQVMESLLSGIRGVFPYLDDVVIATKSKEQNINAVIQIFERFKLHNITVNFNKCKFFQKSCTYLGYHIDKNGISPDKSKINKILELPPPKDVSELRTFLGAINYYGKFIREMRALRNPLDVLLKTDSKWVWSSQCQQHFNKFKELLSSDLLLTHYDPRLPIKVAADGSNVGLGAYICHIYPDGKDNAIAHASRSLTQAEKNYSQIEKEGLALVFAVVKFHKYLYGRKFYLHTDHKPLLAIFGNKKGIPAHSANRLQRWALTLMSYDFMLEYIPTREFGAADILSRLTRNTTRPNEDTIIACCQLEREVKQSAVEALENLPVTFQMIQNATLKDKVLQEVISYLKNGKWPNTITDDLRSYYIHRDALGIVENCIMLKDRLVIPYCFHKRILQQLHKGHQGIERTKSLSRSYVYWPGLDEEIKRFVQGCGKCAAVAKTLPKTTLSLWPIAEHPMQRVHIDIAGPVNGIYYFLIIDAYSKWPQIYQVNSITSASILNCIADFTSQFGNPELIVSDNGTQFSSKTFSDFCKSQGIIHKFTAPYHPQSNGQAERFVDTLKRALKKLEGAGTTKQILQTFLKTNRVTPNRSAQGKSPADLFVGRRLRTELDLLKISKPHSNQRNERMEQQFNRQNHAQERSYKIGDPVYAKLYKLNESFWAPGIITKILGKVNCEVRIENSNIFKAVKSHANQLRSRFVEAPQKALDILFDYFDLSPSSVSDASNSRACIAEPDLATSQESASSDTSQQTTPCTNMADPPNQLLPEASTDAPNDNREPVTEQTEVHPELRRSSRRKRPPAWIPDYHLFKRRKDVGNPQV
ncbi:PREDICTED: uncharacterized protein K02A2.6-like isoform X2 [Rhagoletis zephyria]|uniref:uncharacterized protein K02A2.6-like isoform X2 n=1 Tax=Rhagoletis zephyria TaxID=28612 RepID=UPI0008118706|nr:PREDICTED: uncharacterized protein K02A2.6-like isoform X2 [Rhagoletis zephyria]